MNRGERLNAEKRKKAKVRRIVKETWFHNPQVRADSKLIENDRFVGKIATTSHPCSCSHCGNPRKYCKGRERMTMQEIRELEKEAV